MPILNYTTKVAAWQTIGEIQQLLTKYGATHFSIKNEGSRPMAVSFAIDLNGQMLNFLLPCKHENIWKRWQTDKELRRKVTKNAQCTEEHAFNVAWRITKDWIEAQLALVEAEQVTIAEVFMHRLIINTSGQTLSERLLHGDGLKLLNQ